MSNYLLKFGNSAIHAGHSAYKVVTDCQTVSLRLTVLKNEAGQAFVLIFVMVLIFKHPACKKKKISDIINLGITCSGH